MTHQRIATLVCLPLAFFALTSQAMTPSRAEVRSERDAFVLSHPAPEVSNWVLETELSAPTGMNTRDEVRAERDASDGVMHWDNDALAWVETAESEPAGEALVREDVQADARAFVRNLDESGDIAMQNIGGT